MGRFALLGLVLLVGGCRNVVGPFEAQRPLRVDDPALTLEEQQKLARQYIGLPDDSRLAGPTSGTVRPIVDVGR